MPTAKLFTHDGRRDAISGSEPSIDTLIASSDWFEPAAKIEREQTAFEQGSTSCEKNEQNIVA
jgi:hypothetical protein